MLRTITRSLTFALALGLALPAAAGPWDVPPEGSCAPTSGLRGWPAGEDAPPVPFAPGDVIEHERAELLKNYLPAEIWSNRDKFFYEGMRLEIGACFRDYSPPAFYQAASEKFRGQATVTADGGLESYTAGRPFPLGDLAPDDPQAGHKWAYNVEFRYQGAGFSGPFRIMDMVGRSHRGEPFEGEIFKWQLSFRADQAERGYKAKGAKQYHWVAGGLFFMPFAAREFAWRQYRDVEMLVDERRTDELHAYLPDMRRVRRISAVGSEGLYLPAFSVGVAPAQQLAVAGGGSSPGSAGGGIAPGAVGGGGMGSIGGGAGAVADAIKPKRNGFEGLELRPMLYTYGVLGVRDIIAPINAENPSYPEDKERGFGGWGLSFASDRWDLRRAVVLEATAKNVESDSDAARIHHYVDVQTGQPLYYVSWDQRGELIDVGMYVGRWSEDRAEYRPWPDDPERPIRVIDSVGAAFANLREDGGWRRENWTVVSTPPEDKELRRILSAGQLTKRR
jgi:hypothetical protein